MSQKTYDRQTAKFLAIVGENMPELSGDVMQGWIENPKSLQKALKDSLCPPESGNRALTHLKLIADDIAIATESFTKNSFFEENGPVRLYFGSNFRSWVLSAIPDIVPAFEGKLTKFQLTKAITDSEIIAELGDPVPFTPTEFAALISELLKKQANGETGPLLTNGYVNIFYVKLEDGRVVAADLIWSSVNRNWHLGTHDFGGDRWDDGLCVFSRS